MGRRHRGKGEGVAEVGPLTVPVLRDRLRPAATSGYQLDLSCSGCSFAWPAAEQPLLNRESACSDNHTVFQDDLFKALVLANMSLRSLKLDSWWRRGILAAETWRSFTPIGAASDHQHLA
jgi:hypothetical protein